MNTPAQDRILRWRKDPVAFVRECLGGEPDPPQVDLLRAFADPQKRRIAMKACKGVGKTTGLAWCVLNFMSCYGDVGEHPKGVATSITEDNLDDNLWPEIAKWLNRSEYLKGAFTWTKTRVFAKDHPETWFFSKRTWPKSGDKQRQADTLAGLHAKYLLFLLDESGGIPESVMAAAEGGLATAAPNHFLKILQAGNPTHLEGPLYRACNADRAMWHVIEITGDPDDPKRSSRQSAEWAREQITKYGRDNPWVLVNVFGRFPPASINSLLGPDEVTEAMKRNPRDDEYSWSQKRLGVDVARFGDDRTVIFPRQGLYTWEPEVMRVANTVEIAARVAFIKQRWESELELIDDTGHWGHGVYDNLLTAGYSPLAIQFHGPAIQPQYKNRRAEMWIEMAKWVKRGGALPNVPELVGELSTPTYSFLGGKFMLEDKDQVKERLGRSPDLADALCFVKNTKVRTPHGDKDIQSLQVGDEVDTPMGVRRIVKTWCSKASKITTVRFSNGRVLSGRGEHRVFTWDSGFVRLDALSLVNEIETDGAARRCAWAILRGLFTRARPFGFRVLADITSQGGRMRRKDFFTVGYGQMFTDLLRRTWRSITGTVTGETIPLKTSSALESRSIPASTCSKEWLIQSIALMHFWHSRWLIQKRLSGILVRPVDVGISGMGGERGSGESDSQQSQSVLSVGRHSKAIDLKPRDFARTHASKESRISGARQWLANAWNAVKALCTASIGLRRVVPSSVQTEDATRSVDVYNLTLESENVYYANGILVANCLTFAIPDQPKQFMDDGSPSSKNKQFAESDWNPFK